MNWKATLLAAAFGATLFFAGAEPAQAQSNCIERIRREEWKLQRDIRRHGFFSRQARHRRQFRQPPGIAAQTPWGAPPDGVVKLSELGQQILMPLLSIGPRQSLTRPSAGLAGLRPRCTCFVGALRAPGLPSSLIQGRSASE